MAPPRRTPNDDERTSSVSNSDGGTVLELSFNVGQMIKEVGKLGQRFDQFEERARSQHEETRKAVTEQIERLERAAKDEYATKEQLAGVRTTAESANGKLDRVSWVIIVAVIVAVLGLVVGPQLTN